MGRDSDGRAVEGAERPEPRRRENWVQTHAGPYLWDPVIATILHAPTWVVFGILGVLLYWLGQKRKPVEVFIN